MVVQGSANYSMAVAIDETAPGDLPEVPPGFAPETEPELKLETVGYSAEQINVPRDTWARIEAQLPSHRPMAVKGRRHFKEIFKEILPAYSWKWASAAAVAFLLLLLMNPFSPHHDSYTGNGKQVMVQSQQIVVHSIKVDGHPARTVFFQPENANRLIVWAR